MKEIISSLCFKNVLIEWIDGAKVEFDIRNPAPKSYCFSPEEINISHGEIKFNPKSAAR